MDTVSAYFKPTALILLAQILVEIYRVRRGKNPVGGFFRCALMLVLMDLWAMLWILRGSISAIPDENRANGLQLMLVGALACAGFLPAFVQMLRRLWRERWADVVWSVFFQALPTLALGGLFIRHVKKIFELGFLLYRQGPFT